MACDICCQKFTISRRLLSIRRSDGRQLCIEVLPHLLWQLASYLAVVISVCCKLLVASAGKLIVVKFLVLSITEIVIPLLDSNPIERSVIPLQN
jgi:hypothetical protein